MANAKGIIKFDESAIFDGLTDRERVFCIEYAASLKAVDAAREAGYKNPTVMSNRLMQKDKINKAINHLVRPAVVEAGVEMDRVLRQLANLGWANIIPYLDSEGNLKVEPDQLPESIQQAITSFDVDVDYDRDGNVRNIKRRITLANKTTVMDMLMRYNGGYAPDKVEHSGSIDFDWTKFHQIAADTDDGENYVEGEILKIREQ